MKTLLISLSAFFLVSFSSYAQKDTIKKDTVKTHTQNHAAFDLSLVSNVYFFNMNDLNNRLKLLGYPEISNIFYSFGAYTLPIEDDNLFSRMGVNAAKSEKENAGYKDKLTYILGYFDFGYKIYNRKKISIYPVVGVGFSSLNLKIINKTNLSNTFNQAASNLNGMNEIYSNQKKQLWNLHLETNMDFYFIGADVGYNLQLSKIKWQTNSNNLSDAPNVNLSGFYVGIHLNCW